VLFIKGYFAEETKKSEMGEVCSTNGRDGNFKLGKRFDGSSKA
jgi:hypothetical protein